MTDKMIDTAVIGAGMIGTCVAIELARRGKDVMLLDRREPGRETSFGNLGIVAVGSSVPLNTEALWATLPKLLQNRTTYFRYDLTYVLRNPGWFLNFLAGAHRSSALQRETPMHHLLILGRTRHRVLIEEAGESHRLRRNGWFHLCRGEKGGAKLASTIAALKRGGVDFEDVDTKRIAELEPAIAGKFGSGVWVKDVDTVDDPGAVVEAYANNLTKKGGTFFQATVSRLEGTADGWIVHTENQPPIAAKNVVVALGPWSKQLLQDVGIKLPLVHERGSHREYIIPSDQPALTRPIYDIDGGYAISPMAGRYRITSGVYLRDHKDPMDPIQLDAVEPLARDVIPIGPRTNAPDWFGARPTLPDSLPAIGPLARQGLWLATGHQHLGFSTGPSTGEVLAQMMMGEPTSIEIDAFAPSRFGI